MAEKIALAGLGWVVSPVVKDLVKKSISYLGSDIARGLEDLETVLLPQFELTIEAAQHSPHNAKLTRWLTRLKNAYFDAEAILHELEYKHLKSKAKGKDKKLLVRLSSKPIIKPLAKFADQVTKKASLLSSQKRKLLKRLNKLKEIAAEAKDLRNLLGNNSVIAGNNRPITTFLLAHKVFGRDGERDHIIKFLLDGGDHDGDRYSVIAITGMGGAGKTTLAQYIYNDPRVKKHFPIRMWICISRNLDITKCTKEMIECVLGGKCPKIHNLGVLQDKLLEILPESDNIMLVRDDVWYDKEGGENEWDNLLKPFAFRGAKCKIVVTSRTSWSFPNALQPSKLTELSDLALDDFISLLRYHAIDGLLSNPQLKNDLSDLSDIVDQIAKSMSKSPLAAKVVGNQLREQPDISFWRATLENVDLSDTRKILMWSFHRFEVQLQRCFLFFSVFPKGTRFDDVVPYWVALDFIQPSDDNRNVEDIGLEYFEIMVANSIFHPVDETHKWYTMHDLFHDLAENLSVGDCFRVTNVEREIPSTVQHVFIRVNNEILKEKLSSICSLSNLRTLILGNPSIEDISEIFPKISTEKITNLRVLEVWSRGYKTLPRGLGDVRNLRLLDIGHSSIEELPDSILQLYHLQFLLLPLCVKTLPTKLCNLIKLRHIVLYDSDYNKVNTLPPVPYLGKLTSLQSLDVFHVRKEEGYKLQQLGCLKEIGGSLKIVNLENVRDKEEAIQARLIEKPKLKKLELVWAESVEINDLEIEVIEALQPPTNLEWLRIDGYRGSTYPTWLQDGFFIENAKGVRFYNCNALTILPPNFHQYRQCSEIVLENLGALRELSTFPECLATLSIIKCPCLILICENELRVNENQSKMESGFLEFFVDDDTDVLDHELKSFKQTISVENYGEELQILESSVRDNAWEHSRNINVNRAWWTCHVERMNFIFRSNTRANKLKLPSMLRILHLGYCCISDGALSDCLREMVTLEELYLSGIMTITTLPPIQVLESLQSLRVVEIKDCWYLRSLGGLHAIPNLQRFWIGRCWCVDMFRKSLQQFDKFNQFVPTVSDNSPLPPTLQSLKIKTCVVPQTILNSNFPFLQDVEINNCILDGFLPIRQLTSLKSLVLYNCHGLRVIQGLESRPSINELVLLRLPDLFIESVLDSWQGCREQLYISSLAMLNKLLSSQDFFAPRVLCIQHCEEEKFSFEESDHLQSIKTLAFFDCKTQYLPITLSGFSTLKYIHFEDCHEISRLPELPGSVQRIRISGCPVLRERCQPNGVDWHKIQCIPHRVIQ
ncbi:disease resistance protein RGA2-like [Carex rostrata]